MPGTAEEGIHCIALHAFEEVPTEQPVALTRALPSPLRGRNPLCGFGPILHPLRFCRMVMWPISGSTADLRRSWRLSVSPSLLVPLMNTRLRSSGIPWPRYPLSTNVMRGNLPVRTHQHVRSPRLGLAHQSAEGGLQPHLQPDNLWASRLCLGSGDPWLPSDVLVDDELIPSIAAKVSPMLGQQIA